MKKILYISHDAHFHGAQLLSVAIVEALCRRFEYEVTTILLEGGELRERFLEFSTVIDFASLDEQERQERLASLRREISVCIANTVVAGKALPSLKNLGYRVISLIHELPTLIRAYKLEDVARQIGAAADVVVFPSTYVSDRFQVLAPVRGALRIRPQGLYKAVSEMATAGVESVRLELGIPVEGRVVVGIGFGDIRKGIDVFVQVAAQSIRRNPDLHFMWVGRMHQDLAEWMRHDAELLGVSGRLHFVDQTLDVERYYRIADIMLLTSREDPFPSTVIEGICSGAYVIGFEGAGGFTDLLHGPCGEAVSYLDVAAMSLAVEDALAGRCDATARTERIEYGRKRFAFDDYVEFLLGLAYPSTRVSVVVPSYNYASLIYARLRSIAEQDFPVYEMIVLDDSSTDGSREEIERFVRDFGSRVRITTLFSDRNSGSVFEQWRKGLERATGDVVWIAEADDVAATGFLSALVPCFLDPEVHLAYCQSSQLDQDGAEIAPDYLAYVEGVDPTHWRGDFVNDGVDEIRRFMAVKNTIPNVSAVLFRRPSDCSFMSAVAGYRVAGDWVFYLEMMRRGKVCFRSSVLNGHRRHAGSQTSRLAAQRHFDEVVRVQELIDRTWGGDDAMRARCHAYRDFLREYLKLSEVVGGA